jgi:NAD(P)-dependent dehydrogenase (short-subunit alcohol dehydrogenase family)
MGDEYVITQDDFDFSGKTVLVTGAASGIGAAIARAFAEHGATLKLADRDAQGMSTLAASLNTNPTTFVYDQADTKSVLDLAQWAGTLDVLTNNAGIVSVGPSETHDPALVETVVQTNLIGPMILANAVGARMLERGHGVIINTTSQLAFCGAPQRAIYASTKAGLAQFTRSLASEWAPRGVRVAAIAPGRTLTPLNADVLSDDSKRAEALTAIPAHRFASTQEIAHLTVMLASDIGSYIVGQSLIADGGYVIAQ